MYPDERVTRFISENLIPIRVHVRDQAADYQRLSGRYAVQWTPTVLELDEDGTERHRIEGFLPADDFLGQLMLGYAHIAFKGEQWSDAERLFRQVVEQVPESDSAPEALYWAGVSRYKASGKPEALGETARAFSERYRESSWAKKASIWGAPAR